MKESYYSRVLLFNLMAPFIWSIALIIEMIEWEGLDFTIGDFFPIYIIIMAVTFAVYTPLWLLPRWKNFKLFKWTKLTTRKAFFILLALSGIVYGYLSRELFDFAVYMLIYGATGFFLLRKTFDPN